MIQKKIFTNFTNTIKTKIGFNNIDLLFFEKIEDRLIKSGMHIDIVTNIMNYLVKKSLAKFNINSHDIIELLKNKLILIVQSHIKSIEINPLKLPYVIMICGTNGSGKTTTIGKMVKILSKCDWTTVVAACDTFRSAATEQLMMQIQNNDSEILFKESEHDTAAKIASRAYLLAKNKKKDVVIIDTAGRFHNNYNLMNELLKIKTKLNKISSSIPNNVILIVDASCGYNIVNQVESFQSIMNITGIIVTKSDISCRSGSILTICYKFNLPIHGVMDGESDTEIKDFNVEKFVNNMIKDI